MTAPQAEVTPKTRGGKPLTFKFAYSFLFLDYFLRWVLYGLGRFHLIPGWLFWTSQVVIVPIIVLVLVSIRNDNTRKKYEIPAQVHIWPEDTLLSATVSLGGGILGTYITFSLFNGWSLWVKIAFSVLTFFAYGFYILLVYIDSVQLTAKEDEATPAPLELSVDEWIDENDLEIVRLETDKISLSQRVDTYTLESTLFGALSFSGFVTIIASEKEVLAGVREVIADSAQIAKMILQFDFTHFSQPLAGLTTETALLAAIAVETLICSMFFLSVIVSRLRFNDVLKRVDYAVRIASSYNDKEEEVYNFLLQGSDEVKVNNRLKILKKKITDAVYHAEESFRDLRPIVNYMWVFRNLGLISFLLILITGALWVSPILAILFATLSVLALVYSALDTWIRTRSLEKRGIIAFFRKKAGLFPVPARKAKT
jgi:uncharacterized membrane protein YciS (DUF1049 family)